MTSMLMAMLLLMALLQSYWSFNSLLEQLQPAARLQLLEPQLLSDSLTVSGASTLTGAVTASSTLAVAGATTLI